MLSVSQLSRKTTSINLETKNALSSVQSHFLNWEARRKETIGEDIDRFKANRPNKKTPIDSLISIFIE